MRLLTAVLILSIISYLCISASFASPPPQDIDTSRFHTERQLAPDEDEDFTFALFADDNAVEEQNTNDVPQELKFTDVQQDTMTLAFEDADSNEELKFTDSGAATLGGPMFDFEAEVLAAVQQQNDEEEQSDEKEPLKFTDEDSFVLEDDDDAIEYESNSDFESHAAGAADAANVLEYIDAEVNDIEFEKANPAFNSPIAAHPFFESTAGKTATWVTIIIMGSLWLLCSTVIILVMCCCCIRTMSRESGDDLIKEAPYEQMTEN